MRSVKLLVALLLVVLPTLGVTTTAGAQSSDGKNVVLTVGVTSNSFDTLNPLVGYNVPDYDVWIMSRTGRNRARSRPCAASPSS